jgi:hypothetical protein
MLLFPHAALYDRGDVTRMGDDGYRFVLPVLHEWRTGVRSAQDTNSPAP